MRSYQALQEKRKFIHGKIIIGIDPDKDKNQAVILDNTGITLGNPLGNPLLFAVNYDSFTQTLWTKLDKQIMNRLRSAINIMFPEFLNIVNLIFSFTRLHIYSFAQ